MFNDLRYAWRQLRRTPGFAAIAVLTLALGIAANTTFFALIDAAVWRPLRAINFNDIYRVSVYPPRVPGQKMTMATWRSWRSRALTLPQLEYLQSRPEMGLLATARVREQEVTAQSPFDAGRLRMLITQGNYAGVNRMRALTGQLVGLENNSAQAGAQVVISERLWRSWFRADRAAVGRDVVRLNRHPFIVAGVAPAAHSYEGTDLWVAEESWQPVDTDRDSDLFVSSEMRFRAGAEPKRLAKMIDLALANGPTPPLAEFNAFLSPTAPPLNGAVAVRMTWLVMGLSGLVLLAACANLANMLFARAASRTGEIAVRLSLGASAAQVFRLFLLEAGTIAGLAATAGAAFSWLGLRYVKDALPGATLDRYSRMPIDISPDWRMFAYAAGAGAVAALIVGGLTAWRGSRTPPLRLFGSSGIAQSTGARGKWTRTVLVAVQVSAAVILLLGTGLYLVRDFENGQVSLTFDTDRLATAQIELDSDRFNDTQVPDVVQRVLASVEKLEGIEAGAITDGMFGAEYARAKVMGTLTAEADVEPGKLSRTRLLTGLQAAVSPGFLDVLGLKLQRGRNLRPTDVDGAPEVVLLSSSAAQTLWPNLDPLGRRVRFVSDVRWFTVVGTFDDPLRERQHEPRVCSGCVALTSWAQMKRRRWLVVLRAGAPGAAIQQVRPAVDAISPDVPVFNAASANRSIFAAANAAAVLGSLVGTLGLLSLVIAALGVYGVISYSVSRRTREFGIRLALGATPSRIVRSVVDDAVHLVLVGLLPGVLLASWATRVLEASVVRLMPNDIPTWVMVPILILVIGVFAGWIPARRAARVDPNVALREL